MSRSTFLLLLALAACLAAGAQRPRICTSNNELDITLDPARIWDYNRHEGHRWGLGLGVEFPFLRDIELPVAEQRRMSLDGYVAYGVRDKAWKWGAEFALLWPHGIVDRVYFNYKSDLERAGSRALRNYDPWEVWDNPGFFSQYFVPVHRATVGLAASTRHQRLDFSLRYGQETDFLSDPVGIPSDSVSTLHLGEVRLTWTLRQHFTADLILGRDFTQWESDYYLRLLTQYSQRFEEHKWGQFGLFAQAGYATLGAPQQRWFDLGGTFDAPLFFRNTFHTVLPGEYYDNAFALAFLSYHTPAFYHTRISNPRLFAQAGAMAGLHEGPAAELSLGLDRVIRWGILDLGVAGACQVYPETRFAILSVATLIFEK